MFAARSAFITLLAIASFSGTTAVAQTSAGSGTVIVIPTVANISVYATEVFVRNPNAATVTLNVRYYQSNDGTPPAGLRACAQISIPAFTSSSFDMGAQCGLDDVSDNFGMFILEDAANPKVNRFFAYSRTQTPDGIGFSVEGFPIGNFSGASADVLGLRATAAAPNYRSNCFIGALGESVSYQIRLFQDNGTPIGSSITGVLAPYATHRILDVFAAALGVPVGAAGTFANVRASFSTSSSGSPGFIGFCTLETSANGSADFRVAKSDDALDTRQSRVACYGQDDCNSVSLNNSAQITDVNVKNIHYLILDQPDYVKCDLVGARTDDLEIMLRQPGDPQTAIQFPAGAGFTSGGPGATSFYIYTGEKSAISQGRTTRWYIDVSFRAGGSPTPPINYGITCHSGNGVTVPWLGTTGPANP